MSTLLRTERQWKAYIGSSGPFNGQGYESWSHENQPSGYPCLVIGSSVRDESGNTGFFAYVTHQFRYSGKDLAEALANPDTKSKGMMEAYYGKGVVE